MTNRAQAVHLTRGRVPTEIQPGFSSAVDSPAAQDLRRRVEQGGLVPLRGVSAGAQAFLALLVKRLFPGRLLVVVAEDLKRQEVLEQDLQTWSRELTGGAARILFHPSWEILPHEAKLPHADVISDRLQTLSALSGNASESVVVTSGMALIQKTFSPAAFGNRLRRVAKGQRIDLQELLGWLESQGYEPEAQVSERGTVVLRGGILDLFPIDHPWPVRLEFFGDELESIRTFDPVTQLSRGEIGDFTLGPAGELGLLQRALASGNSAELGSLPEHWPADAIVLVAEPDAIDERLAGYREQIPAGDPLFIADADWRAALGDRAVILVTEAGWDQLDPSAWQFAEEAGKEYSGSPRSESEISDTVHLDIPSLEAHRPSLGRAADPQVIEAQRREFLFQMHRWIRQGLRVEVFCNTDGEAQRFREIWKEYGLASEGTAPEIDLRIGALSGGFLFESARLVVVTDSEIFGRYKVLRPRRLKSPHAARSRSLLDIDFSDLEEGDYVVHLQHGIGRFRGLQNIVPPGSKDKGAGQECLVIEYAPSSPDNEPPRLYVPVSEAHLVSKYVGAGKARPVLNSLGGTRWQKTKAQAQKAVHDLASELLAIQAARETLPGHSFGPDTSWQREFEASFLYEETPDQMRAIVETKKDMESGRPMDRLICGDVGYGKTEVAIRAAFKSVMAGKQVAILVPTTVLAQQHFNTFRDRMADYPIRVELLSRFRTRKEQAKVIRELADGSVDIVIGTHRIVQPDIVFKDLGLVVIDEEQRFGVVHKEKFKRLRQLLDVLTLSATPIPRTLYLALTGARDMSTIETPPQDRLPIETHVVPFDERVIRDAIQRELNRGGQVFFLHNRVSTIEAIGIRLKTLVPKARIVIGHGQMESHQLEEVMTTFVNGQADVLLSTTIIESGIDIPNANTIIIDRADRFGLSELYQLRGRVGRYKHQAYAYLLLPRHAGLLVDARKRLSAIKQYSSLGSGFKIAMRDLEIRGAGNLLGVEQSGHITAVGFDLYCQLLKQSVASLRNEKVAPRIEVQMRLDFIAFNPGEEREAVSSEPPRRRSSSEISIPREVATYAEYESRAPEVESSLPALRAPAYLPNSYVSEPKQRVEIYRRLAQLSRKPEIQSLASELRDRFGPLPPEVELLLQVYDVKIFAAGKQVEIVESRGEKLMLTRQGDFIKAGGMFPRLTKKEPKARLNEVRRILGMV